MGGAASGLAVKSPSLVVIHPSGNRSRVAIDPLPFAIGRNADNHLVLRDSRISRHHARIASAGDSYTIEDLNSSHGTYVNGVRVERQPLEPNDRIEFGFADSYALVFTLEQGEIQRLLGQLAAPSPAGAEHLVKLRALVEVARALQYSLSTDDVLAAVLEAALALTGLDRGFLLLESDAAMHIRVGRDRYGRRLAPEELERPLAAIERALAERRDLLAVSFAAPGAVREPGGVVCVPLVRIRRGAAQETQMITPHGDTIGAIYLDTREEAAVLPAGSRELLQTLALEASTILENARLLEEERIKRRMEEELNIAREIQMSLLPRSLPAAGWLRVAGSSLPSHHVGGDYFDVRRTSAEGWSLVVADVSGKGVSSALLAALLQGAFVVAAEAGVAMEQVMARVNLFLNERTEGEKYATVFYCVVQRDGRLRWANAGHCRPLLIRSSGEVRRLDTTGMPLGMLDIAEYAVEETQLTPGDKLLIYSDGLSEAQNSEGRFFETARLVELVRAHARSGCAEMHAAILEALEAYIDDAPQSDDITAVVMEFAGDG